jgi:hypothetical protein
VVWLLVSREHPKSQPGGTDAAMDCPSADALAATDHQIGLACERIAMVPWPA